MFLVAIVVKKASSRCIGAESNKGEYQSLPLTQLPNQLSQKRSEIKRERQEPQPNSGIKEMEL